MELPIFTVDAFTESPFKGNPAGVCIIAKDQTVDPSRRQSIACEMNISETAFVELPELVEDKSDITFGLSWFTPTTEVNLCGHATLASAAVLFKHYSDLCCQIIKFKTLSGILTAEIKDGLITLDMPLADISDEIPRSSDAMLQHFNFGTATPSKLFFSPMTKKLLVRLPTSCTRQMLEAIPMPNSAALTTAHDGTDIKGVILTAANGGIDDHDKPYDFISRYFAPWVGIPEDPVTGSAHTVLGRYWKNELNKSQLYARQCSKRGGNLTLTVDDSDGRILIAGKACIVLSGKLHL